METESASRPAGLPSSPRSPTLSEISMILPEGYLRSDSPASLYRERPPSPPNFYVHANRSEHTIRLSSPSPPSEGRRGPEPQPRSPPLSKQSSRSTLRRMNDSATPTKASQLGGGGAGLAPSPTIDTFLSPNANNNGWDSASQRRASSGSSSVCSEDFENMKRWPGFDSRGIFDDSGVDLEEEDDDDDEDQDQFRGHGDDERDNDRWDDDDYTSDLYSKRAEMILANAKKRLNVMEGNLRGARQSLVVSPTLSGPRIAQDLSQQLSVSRERDRRLYAGMGPIPPRIRPYAASPLSAKTSPVHSRGLSETAVPLPFASPTYLSRNGPNIRASSAMGHGSGPWSPEGYGNGRFPIRESRSFEVMRGIRGAGPQEGQNHSSRPQSRNSMSPPNHLETLHENDAPELRHQTSKAESLRDQMNDLKGRISSLKMRAQEDNMRRTSMQSLRTPSPFTSAETWYSGADAYNNGTSPIAADAGVGNTIESPTRKVLFDEASDSTPRDAPAASDRGHVEANEEDHDTGFAFDEDHDQDQAAFHYDESHLSRLGAKTVPEDTEAEESDDFVSVYDDNQDGAASSVYEDAVYEMPVTARHEDRLDAFDYENFFLHSAMGTYSAGRRGSDSSNNSIDSVATTRPVTAIISSEEIAQIKRASMHQRNSSMDSVSTTATFATATEGQSDDEENEAMDKFSEQILPTYHSTSTTPRHPMSPRSDSANNLRKAPKSNSSSQNSQSNTRTSSRASSATSNGVMTAGLQTSKIFSILLETPKDEPRLALNEEEKQLIYSLAASFQQVCSGLQNTSGDLYERKEARRRLDEARRILDGEALEGHPF
ncbi:hypothetical protein P280DRAFT_408082 [Massarina eburnea CBS 473.64]|uniref:Uncharacterized protein n=1 Tax=Massarina eburnea CBS 473.64 TaxID=1395130 RepID=A0A6A6RQV7_9PLEO|nr:hypothetical protein P280DRAFT_408082 [Massarina eburnea CBS 473.64]